MENKDMNNRPNERPFFSIVMPVYNGQKYIKTMIESIRRQSVTDWELLVVDDCSTDQSRKIVAELAEKDRQKIVVCDDQGGADLCGCEFRAGRLYYVRQGKRGNPGRNPGGK